MSTLATSWNASGTGPRWPAAAAAVAGFAAGAWLGLPAAELLLGWVNVYLIPAFVELYASGIPFCG